jgi:hypothetical protein
MPGRYLHLMQCGASIEGEGDKGVAGEVGVMWAVMPASFTRRSTIFHIAFSDRAFWPASLTLLILRRRSHCLELLKLLKGTGESFLVNLIDVSDKGRTSRSGRLRWNEFLR